MKFRKKPVVIRATQWFKNGDHPNDSTEQITGSDGQIFQSEGKVVRYYRHPEVSAERACRHCGHTMHVHGWIDTLEGGHVVCPGDFIITGIKGEFYPCKPDIFAATYEPVTADQPGSGNPQPSTPLVDVPEPSTSKETIGDRGEGEIG